MCVLWSGYAPQHLLCGLGGDGNDKTAEQCGEVLRCTSMGWADSCICLYGVWTQASAI